MEVGHFNDSLLCTATVSASLGPIECHKNYCNDDASGCTQTVEDHVSNHDNNVVDKSHGSHATGLVHFSSLVVVSTL